MLSTAALPHEAHTSSADDSESALIIIIEIPQAMILTIADAPTDRSPNTRAAVETRKEKLLVEVVSGKKSRYGSSWFAEFCSFAEKIKSVDIAAVDATKSQQRDARKRLE